jgi:hypothetical protein
MTFLNVHSVETGVYWLAVSVASIPLRCFGIGWFVDGIIATIFTPSYFHKYLSNENFVYSELLCYIVIVAVLSYHIYFYRLFCINDLECGI